MKTIKAFITGTVQGMSFRNFIKENAEKLELKGFARNLEDGRIECVFEGRDENINKMIQVCKSGPKHSVIKEIVTQNLNHQGFSDFRIIRM